MSYFCCGDVECRGVTGLCSSLLWWTFSELSVEDTVLLASGWHSINWPSCTELWSGALQNKLAPVWTFLNVLSWWNCQGWKRLLESWSFSVYLFLLRCSHSSSLVAQKVQRSEWPAPAALLEVLAVALVPYSGHQEVSGSKRCKTKQGS